MDKIKVDKLIEYFKDFYRSDKLQFYTGKDEFNELVYWAFRIIRFTPPSSDESNQSVLENACREFENIFKANTLLHEEFRQNLITQYKNSLGLFDDSAELIVRRRKPYHERRLYSLVFGQTIYPFHLEGLVNNIDYLKQHSIKVDSFLSNAMKLKGEYISTLENARTSLVKYKS
jgi:hypothetical protein